MIHVLLPAYNEAEALPQVVGGIAHTLASGNYHIWIVDDGSSDSTPRVIADIRREIPLSVITHEKNRGLGAALKTGMAAISAELKAEDIVVTLDSDNTQPPQIIPLLLTPIEEGKADIAIASRFVAGGKMIGVPWLRRLTSQGARILFQCLYPMPGVRDYTCGFRAYSGAFLRQTQDRWKDIFSETGFSAMVEALLKMSFLDPSVVEVPLVLRYDRKPSRSKMPVVKNIVNILQLLFKYRRLRTA